VSSRRKVASIEDKGTIEVGLRTRGPRSATEGEGKASLLFVANKGSEHVKITLFIHFGNDLEKSGAVEEPPGQGKGRAAETSGHNSNASHNSQEKRHGGQFVQRGEHRVKKDPSDHKVRQRGLLGKRTARRN